MNIYDTREGGLTADEPATERSLEPVGAIPIGARVGYGCARTTAPTVMPGITSRMIMPVHEPIRGMRMVWLASVTGTSIFVSLWPSGTGAIRF